jgi:flap endonuclease-1
MGVNLSDITEGTTVRLVNFKGWTVAIDAYNALYQFLATIRQPDGTPLSDSKGRTTSHISGLFYRTMSIMELGIRPIYVFDGTPHPLKARTIKERSDIKRKAEVEWKEALEAGDLERARSKAQQTSRLTRDMVEEARRLLDLMGIPHLTAPSEGEAQASHMVITGKADAAASQDFDSLLFGCPKLIRNFTLTGRRKLPKKAVYVNIEPELLELAPILAREGLTREQLVDIALNEGVRGIGPKKALKFVKEHGSLEGVMKAKDVIVEDPATLRSIFLEPQVTDDYIIKWGDVVASDLKAYLCDERDFSEGRVDAVLSKMANVRDSRAQKSLDQFF